MPVDVLQTEAGNVVIRLDGDFDLNNVVEVDSALDHAFASGCDLIVDLSGVTFLDSMLLRLIAHAHERAQGLNRHFVLVRPDPIVWRIFTVTRLAAIIPSEPSLAEAERRLELARVALAGDASGS